MLLAQAGIMAVGSGKLPVLHALLTAIAPEAQTLSCNFPDFAALDATVVLLPFCTSQVPPLSDDVVVGGTSNFSNQSSISDSRNRTHRAEMRTNGILRCETKWRIVPSANPVSSATSAAVNRIFAFLMASPSVPPVVTAIATTFFRVPRVWCGSFPHFVLAVADGRSPGDRLDAGTEGRARVRSLLFG